MSFVDSELLVRLKWDTLYLKIFLIRHLFDLTK